MQHEIERKFLVANDAWRAGADAGHRLRQAYLAETGQVAIRVRVVDGSSAVLTIKSAAPGVSREEYEYPIPPSDADALIELGGGSVLDKTRFRVPHGGRTWEVDVYSGENESLVVAEVEIEDAAARVEPPPWVGREVTDDPRYYAASLAKRPYRLWSDPDVRRGA